MSLYIAGTVNRFAPILGDEWEIFDELQSVFNELAEPLNLYVNREGVDDGGVAIVIHNQVPEAVCVYQGEVFDVNLAINDDESFEENSNKLIEFIRTDERLSKFKDYPFGSSGKRYFVSG